MPVTTKKIAHPAVVFVRATRDIDLSSSNRRSERLCLCLLTGILLALIHFLLELPCFFLVDKGQAGHALLELEGMEKGAILVILEGVIDFLVPDDTSVGRGDVDHLQPEGIPDEVIAEDGGALETCIGPSVTSGVSNIESRYSHGLDLVGCLWDGSLDSLFICVGENGRHCG